MLSNLFGKFSSFIQNLFGKQEVSILSESELASAFTEDDELLRSELKQELLIYDQTKQNVREYEFVTLTSQRIYTDPSLIELEANQQLASHVILVGIDGRKVELDVFFKIGEPYSQEAFYKKIAGEIEYTPYNNLSRSEYVRMATIEENFYVQTWTKNQNPQ